MAVNCWLVPAGFTEILAVAGVTAMETSVADVTVKSVAPEMSPDVAVMVVIPVEIPVVAIPAALMEALAGTDEVQTTDVVKSCVVLSVYVPMAVNCWVVPAAMLGVTGVTAID